MEHQMNNKMNMEMDKQMYYRFGGMIFLSFIAMYILMYAMVNSFANVFSSFNQFYMAGLMTTPMLILEFVVMGMMYPNKKLNAILIGFGGVLGIIFWFLIRNQIGIDDKQFVRSMIPHHGGAVLMCENANLQDQELKTFCQNIIAGQNGEIELMKRIMQRLDGNQTNTDTVNSGMRVEENAIYVEDQKPNTKVLVNTVTLSKPGFVVIHKNNNGNPGEVIGSSQYLPAGNSNNIVIKINIPTKDGEKLSAMPHEDNGDKIYSSSDIEIKSKMGGPIMMMFNIDKNASSAGAVSM